MPFCEDHPSCAVTQFLRPATRGKLGGGIRQTLLNATLWFQIGCLSFPWFGWCTHVDVIHAYALIILWALTHHMCTKAIRIGGCPYYSSILAPGTALMPIKYCLPLTNFDLGDGCTREALDRLEEWHSVSALSRTTLPCTSFHAPSFEGNPMVSRGSSLRKSLQ
eukprot:SAG31_NODE_11979_length_980_cov_1.213394_2_plen_164_part_00